LDDMLKLLSILVFQPPHSGNYPLSTACLGKLPLSLYMEISGFGLTPKSPPSGSVPTELPPSSAMDWHHRRCFAEWW